MKTKTQSSSEIQSESSELVWDEERLKLRRGFRMNARQILCSFSMMLTERERLALHWLAEGLDVGEIAQRLQPADRAVVGRPTAGSACSGTSNLDAS